MPIVPTEYDRLDEDGYPADWALDIIRTWNVIEPGQLAEWFDFILSCWWTPDWGWHEVDGVYTISTGGWSGNESVIDAMQENYFAWSLTWQQSRRGGHFIFKIDQPLDTTPKS